MDGKLLAFPFREDAQLGVAKSGNTYIRQGVPILYMNPNIQESMLSEIMAAFELPIQPVIRCDRSKHYYCYLDNGFY